MPHTLIEVLSIVLERPARRHHKHDPYVPSARIHDLALRKVIVSLLPSGVTMNVTGAFTQPTSRKSGAPLAVGDIDHYSLQRNGVEIQTLAPNPAGPTVSWTDTTPLTGSDTYNVLTITKDGFISDPSNNLVIAIAAADPAAAITDLTGAPNPTP